MSRYNHLMDMVTERAPSRILDIGTWNGHHGAQMVSAAKAAHGGDVDYYGFDLWEDISATQIRNEVSKRAMSFDEARKRLLAVLPSERLHLFRGNTCETLPHQVANLPVMDFVFIDGGHSLETIASDWANVQRLMDGRTVVVFDDYWLDRSDAGAKPLITELLRDGRFDVEVVGPTDKAKFSRIRLACVKLRA